MLRNWLCTCAILFLLLYQFQHSDSASSSSCIIFQELVVTGEVSNLLVRKGLYKRGGSIFVYNVRNGFNIVL